MKKITRKIILLVSVLCLGLMIGCSKKGGEEKEYNLSWYFKVISVLSIK